MRIGLLSAAATVTLALSGVAHADTIISGAVTGTITGGSDGGLDGTYDEADLFGGGNLYGDAVTLSFSYDIDLLNFATANCIDGSYYALNGTVENGCPAGTVEAGLEQYVDFANDSAIAVEAIINGDTFLVTNTDFTYVYAESIVDDAFGSLEIAANPTSDENIIQLSSGTQSLGYGQLENQTTVQNFLQAVQSGTLGAYNVSSGLDELSFTIASSSTPEPATWFLVAMGLGGVVLMKRNHAKR